MRAIASSAMSRRWIAAILLLGAAGQAPADVTTAIVRDGSVGPDASVQPLVDANGVVEIGEAMGDRPGGGVNLFHSFTTFDLAAGDTALFSADPNLTTANIISRVTGTTASMIDGTLASSVPGAALYFLNPNGVLFGATAHIDVPGSLHVATAASVGMLPGDPGGTLTFSGDPRLAFAAPMTFGFLGQPVALAVNGSVLDVAPGATLALVGGDVRIEAGSLRAPGGGTIQLAAVGDTSTAPVAVGDATPISGSLDIASGVLIDVRGNRDGSIVLRGGDVNLGAARLRSDRAAGATDDPGIAIDVVAGNGLRLQGTSLDVSTDGPRRTGAVSLSASSVSIAQGATVVTGPCGGCSGGTGGAIEVIADDTLTIAGGATTLSTQTAGGLAAGDIVLSGAAVSVDAARINASTTAAGAAGSIDVAGTVIELSNGADLQSSSGASTGSGGGGGGGGSGGGGGGGGSAGGGSGGGSTGGTATGAGGNVTLLADERVTTRLNVNVGANSNAAGNAGDVHIAAPVVELLEGSRVASAAAATGNGGSIYIEAPTRLELSGTSNPGDPQTDRGSRITASSAFTATGDAGAIDIAAGDVVLADGARVSSSTSGVGEGGEVAIVATGTIRLSGARGDGEGTSIRVASEVEESEAGQVDASRTGNAGDIFVSAPALYLDPGTELRSSTSLPGRGGTITLDVGTLSVHGASIAASSVGLGAGDAGNIRIGTGAESPRYALNLVELVDGEITTSAEDAGGGDISIDGPGSLRLSQDSGVDASDTGGEGGNVFVDMQRDIVVADTSRILARAAVAGGAGGVISLTTDAFVQSPQAQVIAENAVVINSPETDLESQVAPLPADYLNASALLRASCAARGHGERIGSFTVSSRSGVAPSPDGLIPVWAMDLAEPTDALGRALAGGDYAAAARLLEPAAAIDPERALELGEVRQALGEYAESLVPLQTAVSLARERGDNALLTTALQSRAGAQMALGDFAAASQTLQASAGLAERPGARAANALLEGNLARLAGDTANARDAYRRASAVADAPPLRRAQALAELARIDAGAITFDQAGELLTRVQNGRAKWFVTAHLAVTRSRDVASADELRLAYAAWIDANALAAALADGRATSFGAGSLGTLYLGQRRLDEALALTMQASAAAERADASDLEARWYWQEGRIDYLLGRRGDALAALRRAVGELDTTRLEARAGLTPGAERFDDTVAPVYLDLFETLLAESDTLPPQDRQQLLLEARQVVDGLREATLRDYFHDECVSSLEATAVPLDGVAGDTAVLYPVLLDDRLELIVSFGGRIERHSTPYDRARFNAELDAFRRTLENRTTREYLPHAQWLYRTLLGDVAERLARDGATTLVFVPDGRLYEVPMAALHDGKSFLAERFAVAITPSLTLIAPRPLDAAPRQVLLAGVSDYGGRSSTLPHVPAELDAIHSEVGGTVLLDSAFRTDAFQQAVARLQPAIVHVASHATFADASDTSFVMTYDGRISMADLYDVVAQSRFREPLELLTLSACETATGGDRAALGLSGVAIRAGARSALGTLWTVSDEASEYVLTDFYGEIALGNISKARALQHAQQAALADPRFRHPFYWSSYVLISNWL